MVGGEGGREERQGGREEGQEKEEQEGWVWRMEEEEGWWVGGREGGGVDRGRHRHLGHPRIRLFPGKPALGFICPSASRKAGVLSCFLISRSRFFSWGNCGLSTKE